VTHTYCSSRVLAVSQSARFITSDETMQPFVYLVLAAFLKGKHDNRGVIYKSEVDSQISNFSLGL